MRIEYYDTCPPNDNGGITHKYRTYEGVTVSSAASNLLYFFIKKNALLHFFLSMVFCTVLCRLSTITKIKNQPTIAWMKIVIDNLDVYEQ